MSKQPDALVYAESLERLHTHSMAGELRRLHALNLELVEELAVCRARADQAPAPAHDADGEAFRTAARLGLTLRFDGGVAQSASPGTPSAYEVVSGQDRAAAMRQAVSQATAVIAAGGESHNDSMAKLRAPAVGADAETQDDLRQENERLHRANTALLAAKQQAEQRERETFEHAQAALARAKAYTATQPIPPGYRVVRLVQRAYITKRGAIYGGVASTVGETSLFVVDDEWFGESQPPVQRTTEQQP